MYKEQMHAYTSQNVFRNIFPDAHAMKSLTLSTKKKKKQEHFRDTICESTVYSGQDLLPERTRVNYNIILCLMCNSAKQQSILELVW